MKNIYSVVLALLCTVLCTVSCLDDKEVVTSSDCAIYSFSIGDIKSPVTIAGKDGRDTTITKTIGGASIYFNIDQIKNEIVSVDSLPSWANLSRVCPSIRSTGNVFVKVEEDLYVRFTSGADSLDFTKPVVFLVAASDGVSFRTYTAKINKSINASDSLNWEKVEGANLQLASDYKAVIANGDLYVFAANGGSPTVTKTSSGGDGKAWSAPVVMTAVDGVIDYKSVVVYGDAMYALDSNGKMCKSTDGVTWSTVSDKVFKALLTADDYYIYAFDGIQIVASDDFESWSSCGKADINRLPLTGISSVHYNTKTNNTLESVVMAGPCDDVAHTAFWYKITSPSSASNQEWSYIKVTDDNVYGLPKYDRVNVIRYNGELLALGGANLSNSSVAPYSQLYRSNDNGITWHKVTEKLGLPSDFEADASKPVSLLTSGNYIWMIQCGGNVWKGKINKLND